MDPRYKDAPDIILDQVRMAEDYSARWEAANPGKTYDPSDEEHNEFYESLQRPWSDQEFRRAENRMEAREEDQLRDAKQNERLSAIEADNARLELGPHIEQRFTQAVGEMAKVVGEDIHQTLVTGGWDALHAQDPVTAQVLAGALQEVHPFIAAAVQIDDPRQRIRIDPHNPVHQQWNTVVHKGRPAWSVKSCPTGVCSPSAAITCG